MKRGFTIIELLVASALLGMLVTILTMIFNQSSIAWRVGTAGVADLQKVRMQMGRIQDELDNVLVVPESDNKICRTIGLWDSQNNLRKRAVSCSALTDSGADLNLAFVSQDDIYGKDLTGIPHDYSIGSGTADSTFPVYMVNVMSGGPNNDIDDEEAIWSAPYDTDRW